MRESRRDNRLVFELSDEQKTAIEALKGSDEPAQISGHVEGERVVIDTIAFSAWNCAWIPPHTRKVTKPQE